MALLEYTRLRYGKTYGLYSSAMAFGPSGCSSNNLQGRTWQSAVGVGYTSENVTAADNKKNELVGNRFKGVRLIVIDEISMVSPTHLATFDNRIRTGLAYFETDDTIRQHILQTPFGGIHVIYSGDFYQLDPVQSSTSFCMPRKANEDHKSLLGRRLFESMNVFVELTENVRMKDVTDRTLPDFNRTARIGEPDLHLLNELNSTRTVLYETVGPLIADLEKTVDGKGNIRGPDNARKILCLAPTWDQVRMICY